MHYVRISSYLLPFCIQSGAHNLDTERERKEERERAEQRMGVLTYLAQSTLGKDSEWQAW